MTKKLEEYKLSTAECEARIAERQRELAKMRKATWALEKALDAAKEAFGHIGPGGAGPSSGEKTGSMAIDRRHGTVKKPRGRGKKSNRNNNGPRRGGYGPPGRGGFGPPGSGASGGVMWW